MDGEIILTAELRAFLFMIHWKNHNLQRRSFHGRYHFTGGPGAEIDLDALAHNYHQAREKIGPAVKYLGVVKADAYGHGAVQISRKLEALGADYLAVSSLDEARELRHAGICAPLLVLGHTPPELTPQLIQYHITQTVSAQAKAEAYDDAAAKCGGRLKGPYQGGHRHVPAWLFGAGGAL